VKWTDSVEAIRFKGYMSQKEIELDQFHTSITSLIKSTLIYFDKILGDTENFRQKRVFQTIYFNGKFSFFLVNQIRSKLTENPVYMTKMSKMLAIIYRNSFRHNWGYDFLWVCLEQKQ